MTTSFATFRLVLAFASCTAVSCVARLDDLQAYTDGEMLSGAASSDEETTTETSLPTVSATSTSTSTNSSSGSESSSETLTAAPTTGPTGPASSPCINGTLNSAGMCVPAVRCAPGTFRTEAEGSVACAACPSGMFSTTYDASDCEPWEVCQPGQFVDYSGTSSSNRLCAPCPDGETSVIENAGECSGSTDCPPGTYKDGADCEACSAGSYCSGKSEQEEPCAENTWDDDADPSTPCIAVTSCVAGQYVESPGTTTRDRVCSFCRTGSFSTEDNAASCDDWTTCSAPEEYVSSAPSATMDRDCGTCPDGQSAPEDNAVACEEDAPDNLVGNANFETQSSTDWFSWRGTVSTTTAKAHGGTRSLLVTGPATGPAATLLDSVAAPGGSYSVVFWVSVGKVASAQVNITRALTCSGGTANYIWLANHNAVSSSGWTQLAGNFTIPSDCASPKLTVYAEGGGANVDLYVDDVLVTRTN